MPLIKKLWSYVTARPAYRGYEHVRLLPDRTLGTWHSARREDGNLAWERRRLAPDSVRRIRAGLAIATESRATFSGTWAFGLWGIDIETGTTRWRRVFAGPLSVLRGMPDALLMPPRQAVLAVGDHEALMLSGDVVELAAGRTTRRVRGDALIQLRDGFRAEEEGRSEGRFPCGIEERIETGAVLRDSYNASAQVGDMSIEASAPGTWAPGQLSLVGSRDGAEAWRWSTPPRAATAAPHFNACPVRGAKAVAVLWAEGRVGWLTAIDAATGEAASAEVGDAGSWPARRSRDDLRIEDVDGADVLVSRRLGRSHEISCFRISPT
jgi:hypothetical protein